MKLHWHKYKFTKAIQRGLVIEYRYRCIKCDKLKTRFYDRLNYSIF